MQYNFCPRCFVLFIKKKSKKERGESFIAIRLVERDYVIMREIERWRVCLSRHIKILASFLSQRSCDRRLQKLTQLGYISKKKVLYGIPSLYFVTSKGKKLIASSTYHPSIKLEQIIHDIAVLDTAIYFHNKNQISFSEMKTEKELHSLDGFGSRTHKPDFVFTKSNETSCVEIELTPKAKNRLEKNIKDNFINYNTQYWIVPTKEHKIIKSLTEFSQIYTNINMIDIERVKTIVK